MELPPVVFENDPDGLRAALDAGLDPSAEDGFGNSPLTVACSNARPECVRVLLAAGADVNRTTRLQPPLLAAVSGWLYEDRDRAREVIDLLLAAGADPNAAAPSGETPFLRAYRENGWELAEPLRAAGADVNRADRFGTALTYACQVGKVGDARRLLAAGADPNVPGPGGETPLLAVLADGDRAPGDALERVRLLLAGGADPNAGYRHLKGTLCDDTHPRGTTPLMLAAASGWLPVVEALVEAGADVNAANRKRQTALTLAARNGHAAVVERLRRAGAAGPVDADRFRAAALVKAAEQGDVGRLRELLGAGVPATAADPADREFTALHRAVYAGHAEAVRVLLAAGADVNATPDRPVIVAASAGPVEIVRALLAAGADVHAGHGDDTALVTAARHGGLEVVRALIEAGAHTGPTAGRATEAAADAGHGEVVRLLLAAGVRPGPATLARAAGHGDPGLVRDLLAAGCDPNAIPDQYGHAALVEAVHHYCPPKKPGKKRRKRRRSPPGGAARTNLPELAEAGAEPPGEPADPRREVLDLLLTAGADPNARPTWGGGALHWAVGSAHATVLIPVLVAAGADPNLGDEQGRSPLMAVMRVHSEPGPERLTKLQTLLVAGADINARDAHGRAALHHAGQRHASEPEVRALLAAGADPNAPDAHHRTPLMALVDAADLYKNLPAVRALIEAGADVHARDDGGMTVLGHAVDRYHIWAEGEPEVAAVLRAAGATDAGLREVELRRAAAAGDRDRVRALIADGADVNVMTWGEEYGTRPSEAVCDGPVGTALTAAVAAGHVEVVRDLLAAGARVDLPSVSEAHPGVSLIASAAHGPPEVVGALLAAGADAHAPDAFGRTPLLYAARAQNRPVVDLLLAAGVPADERAADFVRVLDFPAGAGRPEYQRAVADLAAVCGTEPQPVGGLPGVTCFAVGSKAEARALQAGDPEMPRLAAEYLAEVQVLREVQGRFYDLLLADGVSLVQVRFRRFCGTLLGLFPTADPFAVVAAVGPYTKDDPFHAVDLLAELHRFAALHPFRLVECAATSVTVEVSGPEPPAGTMFTFEPAPGRPGRWWGNVWWDD
jgi:ankyrin repeat protein